MIEVITAISLWELVKHSSLWLANLKRAQHSRKQQSVDALRKVIVVARRTAVYVRQLKDTQITCHKTEAELSVLWTELSFALEDLGVTKLAKRCKITGAHWADPTKMDEQYLAKADVGLEKMEKLALILLSEMDD